MDTIRSHCVCICYKLSRTELKALVLWVGMVAIAIREYKVSEVEKALDLFPSGLEDVYSFGPPNASDPVMHRTSNLCDNPRICIGNALPGQMH